jgi:hypothetical protein
VSGTHHDAECRIAANPANPVNPPEHFWVVFDNEEFVDSQYTITVFATCDSDSDPSVMYMVRHSYILVRIPSENHADGMRARIASWVVNEEDPIRDKGSTQLTEFIGG